MICITVGLKRSYLVVGDTRFTLFEIQEAHKSKVFPKFGTNLFVGKTNWK